MSKELDEYFNKLLELNENLMEHITVSPIYVGDMDDPRNDQMMEEIYPERYQGS